MSVEFGTPHSDTKVPIVEPRAKPDTRGWHLEVITIAGPLRVLYSAATWRVLSNTIELPASERQGMLHLPIGGRPDCPYNIHSEAIVSFFISTPEQRQYACEQNQRLHDECKQYHPRQWEE